MINFGPVPIGAVLPVFFSSYAGSTGASVTLTGLAVTDIEIYKGTSMTQRASDAGYALLDTDGIDVDGITGIHAISIDTGDNTDASFFAAGSFYTVIVSAVTVDSQTVNFIAATFRLVPAESSAGVPKVDVSHYGGTAGTFSGGRPEVNTTHAAGTAWGSGAITAGSIATDAITGAKVASDVTIASVTGSVGSVTGNVGGNVAGSVESVTGNVGGNVAGSVGSVTAGVTVTTNNDKTGYRLSATGVDDIHDEAVDGTITARETARIANAALGGKASGLETTTAVYRNPADSKDRITATVDADGNRSAVTLDLT